MKKTPETDQEMEQGKRRAALVRDLETAVGQKEPDAASNRLADLLCGELSRYLAELTQAQLSRLAAAFAAREHATDAMIRFRHVLQRQVAIGHGIKVRDIPTKPAP